MSAFLSHGPILCADWRELPLAGNGRCLVEASAGTGKTWTIAVLYLRLLLECELGPREIVVTTFSIAASQELRERIRARLLEASALLADFDAAMPTRDDDGARWLHARWSSMDGSARNADRNRLALTLAELDLAPIGTLHGLCRRILTEHPFDSGSTFNPGEQIGSADLDTELREDLWRRLAQSDADALDAGDRAWFESGRTSLDTALKLVCRAGVRVRSVDLSALQAWMKPAHAILIRDWAAKARYQPRKTKLRNRLEDLADYLDRGDCDASLPDIAAEPSLDALLADQLPVDAIADALQHPVILTVRGILECLPHSANAHARSIALARYRADLLAAREQRLHDRGQLTFDALIERALAALSGPVGTTLTEPLRQAWPVALVDEFQDTDAQQYAILDRIYSDDAGRPLGRLVMIGDPKQAIYGFRGGDVQAYLDASASARHRLPITINFRSSRELVGALNEVFAFAGPALTQRGSAAIEYAPVSSSGRPDERPLTIDGMPVPRPLAFHLYKADKAAPRDEALKACANQIAQMLDARDHRIGSRLLQPGDIAVLLPWNNDIGRLRGLLAERRVPCVGAGKQSVFATDIARDLQIILHGIEHATDETLVRAALATRICGSGVDTVRNLLDQPDAWQREIQTFARWRQQWRSDGVLAVIQSVISTNAAHLLGDVRWERTLTDLRHLGEILQQQSKDCDGPASLLAWFAEQRSDDDEGDAPEERQLRIESDARRVQLMTLHASKGLQFPIVFLPLLDADDIRQSRLPLVRDADGLRSLDLGSADFGTAVRAAMFDDQDEAFRKLYVALTRAQYACHVYASMAKIANSDPRRAALSALLARLLEGTRGRSVAEASAHVGWFEFDTWPWPFRDYSPDTPASTLGRKALAPPPSRPYEGRYSFSSLTPYRGAVFEDSAASDEPDINVPADPQAAANLPALDERDLDERDLDEFRLDEQDHAELAALDAHHGESFGIALHAIFELRDTRKPMREQQALVRRCLVEMGLDPAPALLVALASRVQAALDAPLLPRAPRLCLSALAPESMRPEMRFDYVLDDVSVHQLREVCIRHGDPDLVPEQAPRRLRGLMTGAIDLIFEHEGRFHVLDYKSNYLGDRLSAYAPTALRSEMDRQHYRLQALLYTVALDRYLRQRLPGYQRARHMGEAICLFVRAAGLAPGAGVWTGRFDDALIAEVDAVLAGAATRVAA